MTRTPESLRSARWFAPDDFRSFGHRSRVLQMVKRVAINAAPHVR
ncbi:hypothetical protein [Delftia tsuruhatensis]|nr:hypothetical protein [Delftia tsuruhatensis]MCX7506592.1 hypothetical protein [Delftia tsuruhatensis]